MSTEGHEGRSPNEGIITFPGKGYGKSPATEALAELRAANAEAAKQLKPARRTKVRTIAAFPPGGHTKVEVKGIKHPAVRDAINRMGDWLDHIDTERDELTDEQAQRLAHHLEAAETTLAGIVFLLGPTKPMGGKRA